MNQKFKRDASLVFTYLNNDHNLWSIRAELQRVLFKIIWFSKGFRELLRTFKKWRKKNWFQTQQVLQVVLLSEKATTEVSTESEVMKNQKLLIDLNDKDFKF